MQEGVVGGFSAAEGGRRERGGVEPGDEELEDVDGDVGEGDALGGGFEEGACEGGAEVGRLLG